MRIQMATFGLLLATAATVAVSAQQAPDGLARARALVRQAPLIDGHNDYPWALREIDPGRDFASADITGPAPRLMTDIPRLRAGGVGGQFWSVYVPAELQGRGAVTATLEQIDVVHRMARRWPDTFELARTAADVERAFAAGHIASMIGVEGGHSIDNSLATLRMLRAAGAGYMTLTHSANVPWADSATDTPAHGGLTAFGEEVVREMNWLGMLVDLSHVSPDTMRDALRVTRAPVIFSHSAARALCDVPRNVPDDVLRLLPANGGVVMVTFVPGFISQAVADHGDAPDPPRATLSQVADHIDHIRDIAGIDHIGLGSDFDGITSVVEGLENVSTYPSLLAELLRRGYSDDDVTKIMGGNVLRAMRAAERVSAEMQKERGPSTATIERMDGAGK
ncbi:MAG: dipeptidase [Vicinamibacterales bacterium]